MFGALEGGAGRRPGRGAAEPRRGEALAQITVLADDDELAAGVMEGMCRPAQDGDRTRVDPCRGLQVDDHVVRPGGAAACKLVVERTHELVAVVAGTAHDAHPATDLSLDVGGHRPRCRRSRAKPTQSPAGLPASLSYVTGGSNRQAS